MTKVCRLYTVVPLGVKQTGTIETELTNPIAVAKQIRQSARLIQF